MSLVSVARQAGRLTLTLENPPVNVLTCAAMTQLAEALSMIRREDRLLVLRGAGKHFSAGADVGEHLPERAPQLLETLQRLFHALDAVPIPSVAVVRGACLGAGLELACACDLLLAAEGAKLGVPEISLGVIAPIAAVDLPARIGSARAADLIYSGRPVSGREAASWGLATESFPDAEFEERAEASLARIASHSGAALRAAKKAVRAAAGRGHAAALEAALLVYRDEILPSRDGAEGLKAFLEKRSPNWEDR